MAKSLAEWRGNTVGKKIDLDNQSYDCVDVPKSWAEYLSGQPWTKSLCWGNAKDIWNNAPGTWQRIGRGGAQPGDIMCCDDSIGGGYGHVAVVLEVNGANVVVAQQNTFTQQAVYLGTYNQNTSYIQGFLRPTWPFTVGAQQTLQPFQRQVAGDVMNYRSAPNTNAQILKQFQPGEVLDFKGFVRGQAVDGIDIWFVGRYTGGYVWAGGFTDKSAHDLPDMTTPVQLQPFQRQVGNAVINYRKAPQVAPDNVIKTFNPGEVLDFDAWAHGQLVDGTDVWFRGKYTGGWSHAGGFTNQGTEGLSEVTITSTPVPPTTPPSTIPAPFTKELPCVTSVVMVHPSNYETDPSRFPAKPEGVVLHDFGTDGKDTLQSSLNHFKNPDTTAPHFVVSGDQIIQTGKLSWRMYHAGAAGNDKVGIEIDPDVDTNPVTKASVETLLKALNTYYGYNLKRHLHSEFMATSCGDDVEKAGLMDAPAPEPTPEDPDTTPPVKPPENPSNIQTSVIRTVVPYIVGGIVAFLAGQGITGSPEFIANLTAVITFLVGSVYYIVVRIVESKVPAAGVLLGSVKKPEYTEKTK